MEQVRRRSFENGKIDWFGLTLWERRANPTLEKCTDVIFVLDQLVELENSLWKNETLHVDKVYIGSQLQVDRTDFPEGDLLLGRLLLHDRYDKSTINNKRGARSFRKAGAKRTAVVSQS